MIKIANLINQGTFYGTLGTIEDVDVATTIVTTRLLDGIEAVKTADKEVWINGELTYTITLTNTSGEDYYDLQFIDELDVDYVTMIDQSFTVDGNITIYTYNVGVLSAYVGDLLNGQTKVIIFKVNRA